MDKTTNELYAEIDRLQHELDIVRRAKEIVEESRREVTGEVNRLRAERDALREALIRLQDICVSPTYRQACFADATAQARAALARVQK